MEKDKNKLKNLFMILIISLVVCLTLLIITLKPTVTGEVVTENPEKVVEGLYKAIDHAKQKGEYKCCIEPACTMCYLGHWKFEKGTCYCDDAIAEGRNEDVCPECVSGIEKGFCSSTKEEVCEI